MKRLLLTAALTLSAIGGVAQAQQVSSDDFSTLTGPQAVQVVARTPIHRPSAADLVSNVQIEQGLVGPQAARSVSTLTRAQVIREREVARAQGALDAGADYVNVVAAPVTHPAPRYAGSIALPAGQ